MVVRSGRLGRLSSAPRALPCRAIPRRALFVAPSQLVMSALKTPVRFSKCFEPVLICLETSACPQAPHAEQDFTAASLLTAWTNSSWLLSSWVRSSACNVLAAGRTQGVVEEREPVCVATLCCPGDSVWIRPSRSRGCIPSWAGWWISTCLFWLGRAPWCAALAWWHGQGAGAVVAQSARKGLLWCCGCRLALVWWQSRRWPAACPRAWRGGIADAFLLTVRFRTQSSRSSLGSVFLKTK